MTTERIDIIIAEDGSRTVSRNINDVADSAKNADTAIISLQKTLKALGAAWAVNEVRKAADEYQSLQNRLQALGVSQNNLADTTNRLADISNRSFTELDKTATLYSRLVPAAKALGATQEDLFKFTQAASQAMTIFGTSGGTATGAMLQLSQAMSRGKVQAQEFRSLMDGMYPLLQVVAKNLDGAGGSVSKLRQMMLDGTLTSKDFFQAAVKGADELEVAMLKMSPTTTQVLVVLRNQFVLTIGKFNEAIGGTKLFAAAATGLISIIDPLTTAVIALGVSFAVFVGIPFLIGKIATALTDLYVIMLANPLTAFAVAIGAIALAVYRYRDAIKIGIDETTTLGDVGSAITAQLSTAWTNYFKATENGTKESSDKIKEYNQSWFLDVANFLDMLNGGFRYVLFGLLAGFENVGPAIKDMLYQIAGGAIELFNNMTQGINNFVNNALDAVGSSRRINIAEILPPKNEYEGAAKNFGSNVANAAAEGMKSSTAVTDWANKTLAEAQAIGAKRVAGNTPTKAESPVDEAAIELSKKQSDALERLRDKYDAVYRAQSELREDTTLLNAAYAAGKITLEERNKLLQQINDRLRDQLDPIGAINREIDRQTSLLQLNSKEQEIQNELYKYQEGLKKQGIKLTSDETAALKAKLEILQAEKELASARNEIYDATIGAQQKELALSRALGQFAAGDLQHKQAAQQFFVKSHATEMKGTLESYQVGVRLANQKKHIIDQAEKDQVISHQTAENLKLKATFETQYEMLGAVSNGLGAIASLQNSHNKRMAEVGKAAAIAQAIINTYQGATGAFTSLSAIPIVGPFLGAAAAAAAIVSGLANVNAIRSQQTPAFAFGGDMTVGGTGGTDSQLVQFFATPGERVSISTPMNESMRGGKKGGDVNNHFTFHMPGITNAKEAKKAQSSMQIAAAQAVNRARRFS